MEVSGQFHGPAALPLGKSSRYSLDNRSESGGEGKNSQHSTCRESNTD